MLSTLTAASRVFIVRNSSCSQSNINHTKSLFSTLNKQNKSIFSNVAAKQQQLNLKPQVKSFRAQTRTRVEQVERAVPIKSTAERFAQMHNMGNLVIGTASALGLGALCYYGGGMSNAEGALERSVLWPQYVKDRIQSTYLHLGGGFAISAASAYLTLSSPTAMRLFGGTSILASLGLFAALIASSTVVQSIAYEPGFGTKQLAWIGHSALLGSILAPLSFVGGPIILRAAAYTAGMVGGLSAIAICAPSEKFLAMSAPLGLGLGVVFASSIGSMFLSPASKIGLGLYGISVYGGLALFSGMLLYDTQKTIKKAELHPTYTRYPYDPINNSLHIYMDIINIFVRLVTHLAMGQRRK